jgi:Flp pilus assembly pilin Flp
MKTRSMKVVTALRRLARLVNDRSGATAVEYALILGGVAAVISVVLYVLGAKTKNLYNTANSTDW